MTGGFQGALRLLKGIQVARLRHSWGLCCKATSEQVLFVVRTYQVRGFWFLFGGNFWVESL